MLHPWLFDCAYSLGRVYRSAGADSAPLEFGSVYSYVRSARCSWAGYLGEHERSIPKASSPAGEARTTVCHMLDAAMVRVEQGNQMGEATVNMEELHGEVASALAALFQYMAAIVRTA